MTRGQQLTERQIETIRLIYAETLNMREAARQAKCSPSAVKKYIDSSNDEYAQLRSQKKVDIIEEVAAVRLVLLEAMKTPAKIEKASMAELATSFGILTDKHQLMTGEATNRTETLNGDSPRDAFARRIDELAARRRSRDADRGDDGPASEGAAS
jgi:predicted DNA-binding protein YlxM (UPF0122 family)